MRRMLVAIAAVVAAACGPDSPGPQNGGDGGSGCTEGRCAMNAWEECLSDGTFGPPSACADICVPSLGCKRCVPDHPYCEGQDVYLCDATGDGGTFQETCADTDVCTGGRCLSACEMAQEDRSNVGCEYWAVDLDNEYSQFNDAAGEQFAVALANVSSVMVSVTIEKNDGPPGGAASISTVDSRTIGPYSLAVVNLPQREVDGSLAGMDEGPGTMLSSRAYRITTNYPIVAYQFNPIIQSFSNGASLLIPTSGLDADYWNLGWPTTNPIAGPFTIPGIPDHSFLTVVGTSQTPVSVTVTLGGDIVGGGPIAATPAGGTVTAQLGAFDVLNLESDGIPGDLSGSRVMATGPVVVFSGGERAIVPYDVQPPPPPGYDPSMLCCTEHFEQQLFPTSALGKVFVTTRSPIRSSNTANPEADVWRVLGTVGGTAITTNLPPPYDAMTVGAGEYVEFWSQGDFVLEASEPVIVAQYLVSQGYVDSPTVGGDPEFILFPPIEQYRNDYIFLTPSTFDSDYCVIAAPDLAQVRLDGENVSGELNPICDRYPAGLVGSDMYWAIRCPLSDGVHRVESDLPVGVTVYGYYNVGSYGYPAGAQLTRINIE